MNNIRADMCGLHSETGTLPEIRDTDWGYSSTNSTGSAVGNGHGDEGRLQQARLAVREMLMVWNLEFPLGVWYDLQDDGGDAENPEQNCGLLGRSGAAKPAMQAVRTVMSAVRGRRYAGMIQYSPSGIYAARFDGQADVLFIVWSDRGGNRQTISHTKDNLISLTGLMGNTVEPQADSSGEAQILRSMRLRVRSTWFGDTLGPSIDGAD